MGLHWPPKDPDEIADFDIDWSERLDAGDTIVTSTWFLLTGALTMGSTSHGDTATKVWLSGGTLGETYTLTNRVLTTGGRTLDQTAKVTIKTK